MELKKVWVENVPVADYTAGKINLINGFFDSPQPKGPDTKHMIGIYKMEGDSNFQIIKAQAPCVK